jgi:hypothetical protein
LRDLRPVQELHEHLLELGLCRTRVATPEADEGKSPHGDHETGHLGDATGGGQRPERVDDLGGRP